MKKILFRLLMKWLLVPFLIVALILFLVLRVTTEEVEELEETVMVVSHTAKSYVYSSILTASEVSAAATPTASLSTSEWYTDAVGTVSNSKLVDVSRQLGAGGFSIYDSPSREVTSYCFISNAKNIMEGYFEDLKQINENLGLDVPGTAASYVREYFVEKHGVCIAAQTSASVSDGHPKGAVPPAIVCRDYVENKLYTETPWKVYWGQWSGGRESANWIDIMIVANEDWDAYHSGEDVPVYYIPFEIVDAKGHAYPWGAAQTYIGIDGSNNYKITYNSSGSRAASSNVKLGSGSSLVDEMTKYFNAARGDSYWLPALVQNDLSQEGWSTSLGSVGNQIEPYGNAAGKALAKFLGGSDAQFAVVGYLVYADQHNPLSYKGGES